MNRGFGNRRFGGTKAHISQTSALDKSEWPGSHFERAPARLDMTAKKNICPGGN
jgi:hypothetical protein